MPNLDLHCLHCNEIFLKLFEDKNACTIGFDHYCFANASRIYTYIYFIDDVVYDLYLIVDENKRFKVNDGEVKIQLLKNVGHDYLLGIKKSNFNINNYVQELNKLADRAKKLSCMI